MSIDTMLRLIGDFYPCDADGAPRDGVLASGKQIDRPFATGMITMKSPHGHFQIKKLAEITYVKQDEAYWVCFEGVEFSKFLAYGCVYERA